MKPDGPRQRAIQILAMPNPMQAAVNANQLISFDAQGAAWERNLFYLGATLSGITGLVFLAKAMASEKNKAPILAMASYFLITSGTSFNFTYQNF